jgi:hypothetical protein
MVLGNTEPTSKTEEGFNQCVALSVNKQLFWWGTTGQQRHSGSAAVTLALHRVEDAECTVRVHRYGNGATRHSAARQCTLQHIHMQEWLNAHRCVDKHIDA